MDQNTIQQQILQFIENLSGHAVSEQTPTATFEEAGIDSILFVKLIVQCERNLKVAFEDTMLMFSRYPDILSFIQYVQLRKAGEDAQN